MFVNKNFINKLKKIWIFASIILIFAVLLVSEKIMTANIIQEKNEKIAYEEWLLDSCKCVEHERATCPTGFELKDNVCRNETKRVFTNTLLACSVYNCSGDIHEFNFKLEKWMKK